jgi:hypothetical protein
MTRKAQRRRVISSSSSLGSNLDKMRNTFDEEGDKLLEDDDENDEVVVVEDPSVLIDMVPRLKTYFRNTACPEGVY